MADDVRRSGRATKGQNTKERDIDDTPAKKKGAKGKGKGAKAKEEEEEEEEQEDVVRCVCGEYEEETDVPIAMTACDKCNVWQHNDCMQLAPDYAPPAYYCEQCRPQDHKDLLAAIKRGETPWENIPRKQALKKKGKKAARKSGAGPEDSSKPATPAPAPAPASSAATGQKRKAEESPAVPDPKGNKKARGTDTPTPAPTSTPAAAPATNGKASGRKQSATPSRSASAAVSDVKALSASRRTPAQALIRTFVDATKNVVKQASYKIPTNQTADSFATPIALAVEHAIYYTLSGGAGEPSQAHKDFCRALVTNLKKNLPLTEKVLNGEVTPEELASMRVQDLATDEQKEADAARMKEHDKQHIIAGEVNTGPRIRRTHKGDEYVDENVSMPESVPRPPPAPKQENAKSPDTTSPRAHARRQPSVTIPNSGGPRRQGSATFDINNVWSNVQGSPTAPQQAFPSVPQPLNPVREPVGPGARPDHDIDELLKDEEVESPPYSPKDDSSPDATVWRGTINGGNLGKFRTSAKYAVGATPESDTLQTTWSALLPDEIAIGGRIAPGKADDYLCGLEWSNSSDLLIIWMHQPETPLDREEFNKFFRYFKAKDRFGVGQQSHNPALKDIYFVPLEQGEEMPTFVKKLESEWPNQAAERMLLVALVVRNAELPHNIAVDGATPAHQPDGGAQQSPAVHQTPITPREEWHAHPSSNGAVATQHLPPHMQQQHPAPANGSALPGYATSPSPYPTAPPTTHHHHHQQQQPTTAQRPPISTPTPTPQPQSQPHQAAPPAALAATRILGPQYATTPAVLQLIHQAPNAGDVEMRVIKECIDENPNAAQDLNLLTSMLQTRHMRQQENSGMEGVESTSGGASSA